MVQYCVVPFCKSNVFTDGVSFHTFPRDKLLRMQWIIKIRRDPKNAPISSTMRVCSKHFLPEDIEPTKNGLRKFLRKGAVPCIFDFYSQNENKPRKTCVCDRYPGIDNVKKKSDGLPEAKKKSREPRNQKALKQPLSGYAHYRNENKKRVKSENPSAAYSKVKEVIASEWTGLTAQEKQKYFGSAAKDKERYIKELEQCQQTETYKIFKKQQEDSDKVALHNTSVGEDPICEKASSHDGNMFVDVEVQTDISENLFRQNAVLKAKIEYLERCLKDVEEERDLLRQVIDAHVFKTDNF